MVLLRHVHQLAKTVSEYDELSTCCDLMLPVTQNRLASALKQVLDAALQEWRASRTSVVGESSDEASAAPQRPARFVEADAGNALTSSSLTSTFAGLRAAWKL